MSDSIDQPNLTVPCAASEIARGIAGYTSTITNGLDQRKINSIYEPVKNPATGQSSLWLCKRPGVADVGSTYGTTGQVAYLWDIAAGALSNLAANRWVFSTSGNDVRASDSSTTTVIATAAGYAPAFVDKTAISGVDTLILQIRHTDGTQRAFYSQSIGTFTEITDSTFAGLSHQGKAEHLDGYMFIYSRTNNRIHNSQINTLATWDDDNYITKQITQDIGTGLAKLGGQLIAFGTATFEVLRNAGNATGSPLETVSSMAQDYGLASTVVTGQRHYTTTIDGKLYWVGSNPFGVFAYNGSTVEKVSTIAIDKILSERQYYFVSRIGFSGQRALVIGLDLPSAATQRSLLFFPRWNDWFEWSSTVFIPQTSLRLEGVCLGVGSNQHKLYAISENTDNYQDAGTDFTMTHQFDIPFEDNHLKRMWMAGVVGATARSSSTLNLAFSDDDWQTVQTARTIDMTQVGKKMVYACGSFTSRGVRMTHTGNLDCRLESFIARVE